MAAGLVELGWEVEDVTAYRTVRAAPPPAAVREAIKTGKFDAVVFTSSSTVRNLVGRRHIAWDEIRDITFDEGDPWATLHLRDTETVAVMAIQRADGASSKAEAQRLAGLIAASRTRH